MNMDMTKILLAVCAVLLMVNTTLVAIDVTKDDKDDIPGWAVDKAAKLNEDGGTIYMRNDDGTVTSYAIGKSNKTFAAPQGMISISGSFTYVFPYDQIAYVRM